MFLSRRVLAFNLCAAVLLAPVAVQALGVGGSDVPPLARAAQPAAPAAAPQAPAPVAPAPVARAAEPECRAVRVIYAGPGAPPRPCAIPAR